MKDNNIIPFSFQKPDIRKGKSKNDMMYKNRCKFLNTKRIIATSIRSVSM